MNAQSGNATATCNFVIFGTTGNLAYNKLLTALYRLELAGKLPNSLYFVAFGRREWDDPVWRNHVRELLVQQVKAEGERLEYFVARFDYLRGELVWSKNSSVLIFKQLNI